MHVDSASHSSMYVRCLLASTLAGSLFLTSGCGGSHATACNRAPQTLSEPIRPAEAPSSEPASAPVPASADLDARVARPIDRPVVVPAPANIGPPPADSYAAQRPGESQPLPSYTPVAASPAPASVTAPIIQVSGAPRYHTLCRGETLSTVSRQYHVKLQVILTANQFKDPNRLPVGTKVLIPN